MRGYPLILEESCADRVARVYYLQGAVGKGPRYAVYDFEYQLASGEGTRYVFFTQWWTEEVEGLMMRNRNKITFIAWSPDDAGIMVRLDLIVERFTTRRDGNELTYGMPHRPRWSTPPPRKP